MQVDQDTDEENRVDQKATSARATGQEGGNQVRDGYLIMDGTKDGNLAKSINTLGRSAEDNIFRAMVWRAMFALLVISWSAVGIGTYYIGKVAGWW